MTSSQHDPDHEPDQELLDRDMAERQAGMDGTVDGRELTRRIAEASRRDGAQA